VIELYVAGALLVLSQLVGIYALKTRKADVVFSVIMALMVGAAIVFGIYGALYRLHHG
jgi:fumarate reductase subunit D